MHTEINRNKISNIIKAGGIFIICLSAFIAVLFWLNDYYTVRRKDRAKAAGDAVMSNIVEHMDAGVYFTDMLDMVCSEFGLIDKEKLDRVSERLIRKGDGVVKSVLIYEDEALVYSCPSDAESGFDLASSNTFNLLSGERAFAIVHPFSSKDTENGGINGIIAVVMDLDALLEKSGAVSLKSRGYNYRIYKINMIPGSMDTMSSFGGQFLFDPVRIDKAMPNSESWHILINLNGGWTSAAEKTASLIFAVIVSFLAAFVVYLFLSLKGRENELRGLSFSDPLTKVKNSRAYTDALEEIKEKEEKFGIVYLDVNDFKKINDTYGHRTGDEVLHIVAGRLANSIRQGDFIYRVGGDEFAILIHGEHDRSFYEGIIRRMKDSMSRKVNVDHNALSVSISCGFARYPEEGTDYRSVMQVADSEMYKDKAAQKSVETGGTYWLDHDVMTGLYNRDGFYRAVATHLKEHDVSSHVLITTDIRNFKIINQLYGTGKGNDVLIKEARLLEMEFGEEGSICARVQGDRFSLLMDRDRYDEENLVLVMNDFAKNVVGDGYRLTVQIGVYEITEPDINPAIMFDKTIMALKSVKSDKEFEIVHYTEEMMKDTLIENEVLSRFDKALHNNEFVMYLQPQVDKDGNLLGAEALARWVSDGKVVAPSEFIPVLEKTNQIYRLDEVIWEKAVKKLSEWKGTNYDKMTISVNISPKDIYYIDIENSLRKLRTKYNIGPESLKLEITETAVMLDRADGSKLVERLKEQGFEVEMDDFGSGYSSLNMLKDIKIDVLKIDMGFLNKTDDEERSAVILDSVITMAKKLGMTVIAEGVENKEQLDFLSNMGCDVFQGYYFSRPMPPEEFEKKYFNS